MIRALYRRPPGVNWRWAGERCSAKCQSASSVAEIRAQAQGTQTTDPTRVATLFSVASWPSQALYLVSHFAQLSPQFSYPAPSTHNPDEMSHSETLCLKDYHTILAVSRDASKEQIRAAYKQLVGHHPSNIGKLINASFLGSQMASRSPSRS